MDAVHRAAAPPVSFAPPFVLLGAFDVHSTDPLHDLVRAARAGAALAVAEVLSQVRQRATALPSLLGGVVVAVPAHTPATLHPLLEQVAAVLASSRGWSVADRALVRRHPAPEAKTSPMRDTASEVASLEWKPPPGRTIVLLDDVLRSGTTFRVCAEAISAAADTRPIVAVALARAIDQRMDSQGRV